MAELDYFGFHYSVYNQRVHLLFYNGNPPQGRVVVPHTVEYNGTSHKVTWIGARCVNVYKWFEGERETDKRKKNTWKEGKEPKWVKDYEDYVSPFVYHDGKGKSVDEIFRTNTTMTSVFLPDSITALGVSAFRRCVALKEINLPKGITEISYRAFSGCISLESISLHEGITDIGACAFIGCTALKEITIPSSVKTIGEKAFTDSRQSKSGLEVVNIMNDEGNVIIHPNAFNPRVKINYLGKNGVAPKSKPANEVEKTESKASVSINLDELILAVIADGIITDKERSVILKKATAAGYDADEVEILLDGKLAEKQNANKLVVKESQEKVASAKKEAPAAKLTTKPVSTEEKSGDGTRSKYAVNGTGSYGKGRMVEAVVNKYVELNPQITVAKLKEVFPERLQGSNFIKDSTADIKDMKRYYESALPGGAKFYISNQWGNQTDGFVEYVNDNLEGITITKL